MRSGRRCNRTPHVRRGGTDWLARLSSELLNGNENLFITLGGNGNPDKDDVGDVRDVSYFSCLLPCATSKAGATPHSGRGVAWQKMPRNLIGLGILLFLDLGPFHDNHKRLLAWQQSASAC
ncbi:hypothetical protein LshimejAT787_0112920 [Lyophyllum shimeji]|uniref:Uncharacterized protein n=1 Tax=Lyophyllum shimeji TaxID=47721 RepID=A0A9P3PEG6_LYOSH|nr:hypothetical protein LshimejAT787_0112920 [Lyophyllum shimeji]